MAGRLHGLLTGTATGSGMRLAGGAAARQIPSASRTMATADGSVSRTTRIRPIDPSCWASSRPANV